MGLLTDELNFSPSLGSCNSASIPQILLPSAQLRWKVALSRQQFEEYAQEGYQLQTWANVATSSSSWSEITLVTPKPQVGQQNEGHVDFFVGEFGVSVPQEDDGATVILEGTTPVLQVSQEVVEFTYRLVDRNGTILRWYGSPESNGRIIIQASSSAWKDDGSLSKFSCGDFGVHEFTLEGARIAWGLTAEGYIRFGPKLSGYEKFKALLTIPANNQSSLITYSAALYSVESSHFSVEIHEEKPNLKIQGEQAVVHVSTENSGWKNQISAKDTRLLDIPNPNVLVAVQNSSIPRIHFLPVGTTPVYLSLDTNHVSSLLTEISAALVQPHSGKLVLLQERSQEKPIRIAVGETGGEILLSLVHPLDGWRVLFTPLGPEDPGLEILPSSSQSTTSVSVPQEKSNETALAQKNYKDPIAAAYLFALAIQLLQMLFKLLPSSPEGTAAPGSPPSVTSPKTPMQMESEKSPPRLSIKAKNEFRIILRGGGNISKIALHIDGCPTDLSPTPVGEAWVYNVTEEHIKREPEQPFEVVIVESL